MTRALLATAAAIVLTACGGAGGASSQPPSPPAASDQPITIELAPVGGSGVSGKAQVIKGGDGSFTVVLKANGLAPNSSHASHIHLGTCDQNGKIAYALQTLVAGADGSGSATSTVAAPLQVPAAGWYLNLHAGPDLTGPNAKPITCGNFPALGSPGAGSPSESPSSGGYGGY